MSNPNAGLKLSAESTIMAQGSIAYALVVIDKKGFPRISVEANLQELAFMNMVLDNHFNSVLDIGKRVVKKDGR